MRNLLALAAAAVFATLLIACPPTGAPTQPPATPPPGSGYQPGAAVGAACDLNNDCASGVCEGQGCGAGQGVCADAHRACTMDAVRYCGCDGQTFTSSGSCAGKRFAARGPCEAAAAKPDGAACLTASDCASGICEGQGCGDDAPGTCMAADRACTKDLRTYCGCDGATFHGSGSCPGRRYATAATCQS